MYYFTIANFSATHNALICTKTLVKQTASKVRIVAPCWPNIYGIYNIYVVMKSFFPLQQNIFF